MLANLLTRVFPKTIEDIKAVASARAHEQGRAYQNEIIRAMAYRENNIEVGTPIISVSTAARLPIVGIVQAYVFNDVPVGVSYEVLNYSERPRQRITVPGAGVYPFSWRRLDALMKLTAEERRELSLGYSYLNTSESSKTLASDYSDLKRSLTSNGFVQTFNLWAISQKRTIEMRYLL